MNPISRIKKSLQDRRMNTQRNAAVERGDFLYYIVSEDTNLRNRSKDDDEIVIYSSRDAAEEEECEWLEEVISVSEYNRLYGRFMEK